MTSPPPTADVASAPESSEGTVVVITGPTAAGKTSLAIEVAQRFDGEVVNADSMQVYQLMDIGTAKPSLEERATVPHHLFDVVRPDAAYSAGRYTREARTAAAGIFERGKIVVLTGGTGLYIRSFLDGLIDTGPPNPELRARLEAELVKAAAEGDPFRLHNRLRDADFAAAERIHPNDSRRTVRALEILEGAGRPASSVRDDHGFGDKPFARLHLAIDPGREIVNERINARSQAMVDDGLLREVRNLNEAGYGPELRPLQAIGYRHMNPVAEGIDTLVNAVLAMQKDTRQFARRQRTWLRGVAEAEWMDPTEPDAVYARVEDFLAQR
jgi:tRNA dimethylallyltransferase